MTTRPVIPSLALVNPDGSIYNGNDIRVIVTATAAPIVEKNIDNVWNRAEWGLASDGLQLGENVTVQAVGHHLQIKSLAPPIKAIIAAAHYDDTGSEPPHTLVFGPIQTRFVFQADDTLEKTLTDHTFSVISTIEAIRYKIYYKTGVAAATAEVEAKLSSGIPPNDIEFFSIKMPASHWPANSEVEIDLSPGVGFKIGDQINWIVSSANAFSLKYEATGIIPWILLDFQTYVLENIVTAVSGINQILTDGGAVLIDGGNVLMEPSL